jgi:hypothetical protein
MDTGASGRAAAAVQAVSPSVHNSIEVAPFSEIRKSKKKSF